MTDYYAGMMKDLVDAQERFFDANEKYIRAKDHLECVQNGILKDGNRGALLEAKENLRKARTARDLAQNKVQRLQNRQLATPRILWDISTDKLSLEKGEVENRG